MAALFYDSFLGMMDLPFAFFTLASFYFMFHRDQNASKTDLLLSYGFAAGLLIKRASCRIFSGC